MVPFFKKGPLFSCPSRISFGLAAGSTAYLPRLRGSAPGKTNGEGMELMAEPALTENPPAERAEQIKRASQRKYWRMKRMFDIPVSLGLIFVCSPLSFDLY